MKHERGRGLRGALLAAAAGSFVISGAAAAQSTGATAPGADLRRQLGELAANPGSVSELVETGRTALAVGDGEAALGFFTRASQLAPRDARVKAGLASANARTGRPETALLLFAEALAAGAPAGEIAAERGLAYDLLGQPARAQQDYLASLKHREDPEVRRRLALSLAISGQGEAALRLLDPQVRQGDRAGSRARVMVMALSGDVNGASAAARASLPPGSAEALSPFLTRLASLDAGQMAAAANLGRLPSGAGGRMASTARTASAADPGALAFAGGSAVASPSSRLPVALADSDAVRRRPGAVNGAARATDRMPTSAPARTLASASTPVAALREAGRPQGSSWTPAAAASPPRSAATTTAGVQQALVQPHPFEPLRLSAFTAAAAPQPAAEQVELAGAAGGPRVPQAVLPPASEEPTLSGGAATAQPVQLAEALPAAVQPASPPQETTPPPPAEEQLVDGAAANLAVWNSGAAPVRATPSTAARISAPVQIAAPKPAFSDVIATVSSLPTETSERPAATSPTRSASSASRPARTTTAAAGRSSATRTTRSSTAGASTRATATATRTAGGARSGAAASPSRIWVQLGVSANRAGFDYEIGRMRRAAPELFKNRTPHIAPIGSSHRLLVGPFPSQDAARTFVNGLKQKNILSLTWTSPAGTQVERFAAGR